MKNGFISRSALFKSWDGLSDEIKDPNLLIDEMIKRTQEAPAVDIEPVRHGKWIDKLSDCYWPGDKICSECGAEYSFYKVQNYCPNCGARMDAKEAEK